MTLKIEFDQQATDSVHFLRVALGIESNAKTLIVALSLLRLATEAKLRGEKVIIGNKEVVF